MKTIREMAREAGVIDSRDDYIPKGLEAFAALVRKESIAEANAKANASWTLMCEKMVAIEREACAKVCDDYTGQDYDTVSDLLAEAIRARSNT